MKARVYMVVQDGDSKLWKAETPTQAIEAAFADFEAEAARESYEFGGESMRDYWNRTCFESCALIGELANP